MIRFNLRTLLFLILFYISGYIYFFISAYLSFPAENLLHIYKVLWIFEEALRQTIESLPALTISAVLISFSTLRSDNLHLPLTAGSISKPVSRTLVLLLMITLLYSALYIGLLPELWKHRHDRLYSSSLAQSYMTQADEAMEKEDLETAYLLYREYLAIDEDNRQVKDSISYIEGQITIREAEAKAPKPEEPLPRRTEYRNMNVVELVEKAQTSLNDEDPFTAHYLAGIALDMDESREDAKQIAARALAAIAAQQPGREQRKEYEIYQRKLKGYQELTHQRPIEAYYIFKELQEEIDPDRDIDTYYRESLEQTRLVSFFIEDAENSIPMPGIRNIVYLDEYKDPSEEPVKNLVSIQKLVRDGGNYWAHGVEIMSLASSGEVDYHLRAQYARILNDTLLLKGISRTDNTESIEPEFYSSVNPPEVATVLKLSPTIVQLMRLSREQDYLQRLSLPDLFQLVPKIARFGYPSSQFHILLLLRLLKPFLFLILSVLALGLGWRLRIRGDKFPWLLIWIVPFTPFVISMLLYLIEYGHQIILMAVVLYGGLYAGIAVLIFLEALLLFLSLLPVALQKEL